MADIKLILDVDATGAVKNIETVRQEIDKTAKTSEKGGSVFSSMWGQVAVGTIAANAAMKAMSALKNAVSSSIEEAIKQENAEKALEAALASTGRTIAGNLEYYKEFAAAQQKVTTYTDDEIMAAQALLLQMTRLNQQGISQAMKGAMGLASTLKIDLQSATLLVAKAMEGNYAVLSRYGIKINENLSDEERRAQLLEKLSVLYNRATAETDTYSGKVKQLKNAFGDVEEKLGDAIIKNQQIIKLLDDLKKKAEALAESKDFQLWLSAVAEEISAVARATGKAIDVVAKFGTTIGALIGGRKGEERQNKELEESYRKLEAARERAIAAGAKSIAKTKEMIAGAEKEKKAVNETGVAIRGATQEDEKAKKAKEDLTKATQDILKQYFPLEAKIKEVLSAQKTLNLAYRLGIIDIGDYQKGMTALQKELERLAIGTQERATVIEMALKKPEKSLVGLIHLAPKIEKAYTSAFQKIVNAIQKNKEAINGFISQAEQVLNMLDGVFAQIHMNEEIRIENEYKKRLEAIKKSTMSEEEKQKAIEALEAEYQIKKTEAKRKAAKEEKAVAIFSSIIETARAVTEALPNLVLAAIVAAIGAAKTAFIAAQPIPLAQGAVFEKPTKFITESGQAYIAGEAGPEILGSEKKIREIIRQEVGNREINIAVPIHLEIGNTTLTKEIINKVKLATKTGQIRLDAIRATL